MPTTKNSINQKRYERTRKMGWVFPDSTINPATDLQANKWHTVSAMWYELTTGGDFLKRDTTAFGTNFYFTTANAQIVRDNCTVALVNISSGNDVFVNALTASSTKRALLIAETILFCDTNFFDGVDVDMETFQTGTMTAAQWTDFKTFIRELGDALHSKGLMLSIELPPVWNITANTESGSGDAWDNAASQGYYRMIYAELNSLPIDQVVIMAYDYQYDYSAGQPNQPLKWLKEILQFARKQLDENKIRIVAGLPSAGYSGTTGGYSPTGRTYTYLIAQTGFSGASRDTASGELIWANAGISYGLCDDNSIAQKIAQAEAVGIFDIGLWHIGDNRYYNTYGGDIAPHTRKLNTNRYDVLFTQTADKTVTNTTTETSLIGTGVGMLTLPANFFDIGRTIRVTMAGVYSTVAVTGDTVTIKVKYGSTVIATKATTALVTGGTNLAWEAEALITCRSTGTSGTVQIGGGLTYQIAAATAVYDELNNGVATSTLNTTTSNLLDITVTHSSASASNTVKSLVTSFEILN